MQSPSRALLLLALVLAAINLRPGITSLAPLIERIASELSLSRGLVSLTTALPVLCMGLLAPFAPRLAARLGLERTIALCLGVVVLALSVRLLGHSRELLIGSALLLGASIAMAGPLLSGFIRRHFAGRMSGAVAWYSLSMAVGGASGAVLTVPLTHLLHDDWTRGLAIWAMPAVLGLLLWLRIPGHDEASEAEGARGLPWRQPRAWMISGFFALQAGVFYALATWSVARYHEAGLSALHSNALFSLSMLMGLPSSFVLPWLTQRFGHRYRWLMACGTLSALGLGMITFAPTFLPTLWALTVGFAIGGSFALSLVLPLYEARSPLEVSRWTAMMLFVGYGLGCCVPVLIGLGRDLSGDYRAPFAALMAMALAMILLAWRMARSSRQA